MAAKIKSRSLFDKTILIPAIGDSFRKLDPRLMVRNPVMFVAMVGALVTTAKLFYTPVHGGSWGFFLQIALWLWFTVVFANFAEAMAEGRGKAQAATLRTLPHPDPGQPPSPQRHHRVCSGGVLAQG